MKTFNVFIILFFIHQFIILGQEPHSNDYAIILKTGENNVETQQQKYLYKDRNVPIEDRIDHLLGLMTLDEKIKQMNQWTYGKNANPNNIGDKMKEVSPLIGSLLYRSTHPEYRNQIQKKAMTESRLGIPIIFGFDAIHGYRTVFPIPLAQACSWNTDLVKESCKIAAKEGWLSGLDWTFSPMLDVARDARWGRVSEGYGEDVYANSQFAIAAVKGYQGEDLADKYTIAACLKHYVGYSLSEGGRDYRYSDVSMQTLWETFLPPFQAGIKAGAATVMSGFNDITGVPASANHYTLTEVLKDQWQHDGFVISDWGSIRNLVDQGVAKDRKEAGLKSFLAGIEMDMVDDVYIDHLPELVAEGKLSMSAIDDAVRRIIRVKMKLGLFENPYVDVVPEDKRYLLPEYLKVAEELASESMVLLKNDNKTLPITSKYKQLAIIGPMVKDSVHIMGFWEGMGRSQDVETIYEGLEKEFGNEVALNFAAGCDFEGEDRSGFKEALETAEKSDIVLIFLGEKRNWSGENGSRSSIALPKIQEDLVLELLKAKKPIVLILSSGRPLELIRLNRWADAIIEIWQPGTAAGSAVAGILSGRHNPSGKLSMTFPQTTGQIPMYYNMRKPARPNLGHYQDIPRDPLYWFGHGLSYSSFDYGPIKLSKSEISKTDTLIAEVEVTNAGTRDGKETVLWYIRDPIANISRPMKELQYFEKKYIRAGETIKYSFEIDPLRDLSYLDSRGNVHLESGDFYILVNDQKVKFEIINR
ncbi:glycoside hydrolase family 3 N-terminal domain-containing protein [Aestuariivivens sediminis]|uniref:glycoside hydrolase family 3 N-terminal domain-containing protein n=1 Tax=Aestuariivivens sediminis TaxID=2913557 RepID=UPI001F5914AF|nr:glycoside hydrolase family 3 N-terminal domain-containing protein [Aestuariivivens sediminis]